MSLTSDYSGAHDLKRDTIGSVPWLWPFSQPLITFTEMWYQVFLWALFSSLLVHLVAATIAFGTLRKHRFGKFFPLFIIVMGVVTPASCGAVTSAAVAFVYRASSLQMSPLHALVWGTGQTVTTISVSFTRILATL